MEVVVLRQGNAIQRLRCRHWWTWSSDYRISVPLCDCPPAVHVHVPVTSLAVQLGPPCVRRRADHAFLYRCERSFDVRPKEPDAGTIARRPAGCR